MLPQTYHADDEDEEDDEPLVVAEEALPDMVQKQKDDDLLLPGFSSKVADDSAGLNLLLKKDENYCSFLGCDMLPQTCHNDDKEDNGEPLVIAKKRGST
ncbi:hypothetical protein JTE90_001387 [Oedothorax gibbosus]|uniref:Uncharacterized protein n=1 Tax=Oedothorax gibbosus TaxID=931172 RepID=A0AAV6VFE2_9ARAC|nr:hypothetical protein JTE90_001387 [Oedothorax gibbosus]